MPSFAFDNPPEQASPDERKRQRILAAAAQVVFAYGYQRTSMDDIAKAAEVSRPALYLHFRNKSEIFRAIAAHYFERSAEAARAALQRKAVFEDRLKGAIDDSIFGLLAHIHAAPHGAEIMDLKNVLAGDLHEAWFAEMTGILAAEFQAEARRNGVDLPLRGLSGEGLARIFLSALEGVKAHSPDPEAVSRNFGQLLRIIAMAVGAVKGEDADSGKGAAS